MKFTQNLARAAMLLLLAVLTSIGAWANEAEDLSTPLTLEAATDDGATVTFYVHSIAANGVEYSTDGGTTWTTIDAGKTGTITLTNAGDKVQFRGDNAGYSGGIYSNNSSNIYCSDDCYVYGNIMSLITPTGFATATELTQMYTFYKLFYENSHIVNYPENAKKLMLPATKLSNYCYGCMFYECTSLTEAPALPATTLADYCYYDMFAYCTSLTEAPALPATKLANYCYEYMFFRCTSLTEAPALPATTLAEGCYCYMFYYCTSLVNAPALPATKLADYCYYKMFYYCYELENAPVLPATKLAYECYEYMFYDCEKLNRIVCLATDISASDCTYDWVYGVAEQGTIYIAKGMREEWENNYSDSGIPSGWTVVECEAASVAAGSFSTLYYDEDMSLLVDEPDLTFYTVKSVGTDKVVLQKITQPVIPAGTPFLVYNASESAPATAVLVPIEPEQQPQPLTVAPEFKGTATVKQFTADEMAAADHYKLQNNSFLMVKGTGSIAAHRCWLEVAPNAAARQLNIVFDDATGINETNWAYKTNRANETYYDLQGRKIVHGTLSKGTLPKGLYIHNGKKIFVK